jgi:hypothetical protein
VEQANDAPHAPNRVALVSPFLLLPVIAKHQDIGHATDMAARGTRTPARTTSDGKVQAVNLTRIFASFNGTIPG